MIDHFGINCADLPAAAAFYDKVLGVLGFTRQMDFGVAIGYGPEGQAQFWIGGDPSGQASMESNREVHVAFSAASTAMVDEFFAAAKGAGAEVLHAPRLWPEYHPGYYGAFVRDPDGNNVEAVFHG
ncbi:VOC family protein [Mycobacteroides abscessus]|uniref:VOC family protein n=1 Tax=Mycobacteroides abscessus TaxID=36809 RepID=UPI000927379F|nr:VOC family protein [Mycobacteroides abscessus]SKU44724.1 putative glyoxalase/bleomycin resistance protein [Mycobacteroides abscessus subsp. abscessus]SHU13854.1 putative glyoxalase/bleomycin resistance protein [Mycobacteroides abscessus subsp. bolletii]SHW39822.1 putative glyoxalase/bleomycin resistance protein [Mycobacteroides abscessus subsp. bolletii]SHX54453.1 putative glyoxalase/bleomycin resistance protein [Mycobacteroides abscessus subsp. bolletii]SHY22937.1 putative glyoxalase/bleom